MKVGQVLHWLDQIAPFASAESFDNVGLLIGDSAAEVTGVVFGMDLTEALAQEAFDRHANLIVTHHPFIFHAMKRIDYTCPQSRILSFLLEKQINVIAAHTNWDKAVGGISDSLACQLELSDPASADDYVRVGTLPQSLDLSELAAHVKDKLSIQPRVFAAGRERFTKIAVAGGAYGEGYLSALSAGAEAFVVGEAAHHEILDATARGLTIIDASHFATERPGVKALYLRFLAEMNPEASCIEAHLHDKAPYAGAFLAL